MTLEGYIGFIVSALSVLVTALLGWQIYSVFNFKNEKKMLRESLKEELLEYRQELKNYTSDEVAFLYTKLTEYFSEKGEAYYLFSTCVETIKLLPDDQRVVNACVLRMYQFVKENAIKFNRAYQKERLLSDIRFIVMDNPIADKELTGEILEHLQQC